MNDSTVLEHLEELAARLGIQVRFERIKGGEMAGLGGLCILKGQRVIIINSKATTKDKVRILLRILKTIDLDGIYIRPALREMLDRREDTHE